MGEWGGKGLCEVISKRQKRKMIASYRSQMWAVAFFMQNKKEHQQKLMLFTRLNAFDFT